MDSMDEIGRDEPEPDSGPDPRRGAIAVVLAAAMLATWSYGYATVDGRAALAEAGLVKGVRVVPLQPPKPRFRRDVRFGRAALQAGPHLQRHGDWLGAMYTRSDGHAEPLKATQAFCAAAVKHGARVFERCTVEAITPSNGTVSGLRYEKQIPRPASLARNDNRFFQQALRS